MYIQLMIRGMMRQPRRRSSNADDSGQRFSPHARDEDEDGSGENHSKSAACHRRTKHLRSKHNVISQHCTKRIVRMVHTYRNR
jgi:hypothetical protein